MLPTNVRPLIVPSSYFTTGAFPAPHVPLTAPDLALTCVMLSGPASVLYVEPQMAESWRRKGIDWVAGSLTELRRADERLRWTHESRDEDGQLNWIAFMNDDGLGSSRLLLTDELARQFPEGYLVALPDRSCGLAISKRLGWNEHREVEAMVADMHKGATTPMCSDVREPRELLPRAA